MKVAISILALIATAGVTYHNLLLSTFKQNINDLWATWKAQHDKDYSINEESMRKEIFSSNFAFIQATQNLQSKWALNKFADLTGEEFKEKVRCMDIAKSSSGDGDEYCPETKIAPSSPKPPPRAGIGVRKALLPRSRIKATVNRAGHSQALDPLKVSIILTRRSFSHSLSNSW